MSDAPDLKALVAHYQQQLRLLDWRIDISYQADLASNAGRPVWGLCYPIADAKKATIVIRDPSTPPEGVTAEEAAKQVVETVVHELVHLHFAAFENRTPAEVVAEEQAVWALAEALVNARGTPEEPTYARAMVAAVDAMTAERSMQQSAPPAADAQPANPESQMDPTQLPAIAEALGLDAGATVEDILAAIGALMKKIQDSMTGDAPAEPPPDAGAVPAEVVAAAREVLTLTGRDAIGAAVEDVKLWRAAYLDLADERAKVAKDRAKLEATERRELVAKLVSLGAETPATAFKDATQPAAKLVLCKRLADEPISELRARVAVLAMGRRAPELPTPPAAGGAAKTLTVNGVEVQLSAEEVRRCEARKAPLERYAEIKLRQGLTAPVFGG
jgi:hypothetical protein